MTASDVKALITTQLVENFIFDRGRVLDPDASLMEEGILDSVGVFELITWLEKTFAISVGDQDLTPENLDSVNRLTGFVTTKREKAAA
ncbi:acyl carrier protein [Desulfocurvibacter africanus PCS]|uniref:Acyl carrier protein n=1 Tax=Desulfocurvibacter africanus PCS TaxID=1262666 RepID=M5PPQ6_DESAF|nr:acyl carrier protein [Desulfocurvibacter africanus]EMG35935.1 acyl carrier protein [Desulfocurvibacter africanus PCS]